MLNAAPPLSPYHRLGRTAAHRWWRPVAGTALVVAGTVVLIVLGLGLTALAAALAGRPNNAEGMPSFGPLADLALEFLFIATLLPVTLAAARWVQRRPAGTLSSVTGRLRLRWLLTCLPVAFAAVVLLLGADLALTAATGEDLGLDDELAGWGPFALGTLVLLAVVPLQAAAEEYLTRGWLLQAVGTVCRGPWVPIAVQAIVFAALHGWGTPWGFADLIVFGAVTGWLTVRTGGLEAAIALHVLNNLVSGALSAAYGNLTIDETAADMPWQFAVIDVPVLLAYAAVIAVLARRRRIADRSAPPAPVAPAPLPILDRPLVATGRES
ncbi:CPBP family intramembrane glutamic endopeptidase [Actinoplanes sp. ATCC 53533]|uniref:CPBP family intramembrane glutamic endopeptidase n=1 Tax=Actinoplanes sp. ATCC 53533 TaxID=1288362 RepID=UPI0013152195|nr:type II CAAX endopeptidase family protein [Actinoplanes sp. ATCC 53533]